MIGQIHGLSEYFFSSGAKGFNGFVEKYNFEQVLIKKIFYLPSYHQVLVERHGMSKNMYDLHKATICRKGDDSSMALPCDKAIYLSHASL